MIFNLGMSFDFGEVDIENIPLPAYMLVDYIRVYQDPEKINVGCDGSPDYNTSQWIACHRNDYMTNSADKILFAACESSGLVRGLGALLGTLVAAVALM